MKTISPAAPTATSRNIALRSTGRRSQTHAMSSGDAPVSESGKGRTTESPGPVRTFKAS